MEIEEIKSQLLSFKVMIEQTTNITIRNYSEFNRGIDHSLAALELPAQAFIKASDKS